MSDDLVLQQIAGEAMVARGLWTPEQVAADRASMESRLAGEEDPDASSHTASGSGSTASALGAAVVALPEENPSVEAVDPLDALAFAPAASPSAYNFPPPPAGAQVSMEQATAIRAMLHTHEIPTPIGNEIGRLWNKALAQPPTEAQLERGRQDGHAALTKMWGQDTDKNLAIAQREVQRMAKTNPEIKEMLVQSGLGNSPWLASTLVNLARARGRG